MTDRRIEVSVVIPAFNEADRIQLTLKRVRSHLDQYHPGSEVLVVDDGSSDRTPSILQGAAETWSDLRLIQLPVNRGKGCATRTGVLAARGEWILCSDADLSTPIEELDRLLARTGTSQVVIGSRSIPGAQIARRQPLHRVTMGLVFNRFARLAAGGTYADTQCGFKLYRRDVAHEVFSQQVIDGFAFDVEVLYLARKLGYRICEEPVAWLNDEQTKVDMFRDPIRMLADLVRIRWLHRSL